MFQERVRSRCCRHAQLPINLNFPDRQREQEPARKSFALRFGYKQKCQICHVTLQGSGKGTVSFGLMLDASIDALMPDQLKKEAKIAGFTVPEVTKEGTGFFRCIYFPTHTLANALVPEVQ